MIPFEFVVEGVPKSLQAKSTKGWQQKVSGEARILWTTGDLPTSENVQVTIIHFYRWITYTDIDNILKPIIDALKGLVFIDDRQITDVIGRKRNVQENFDLQHLPPLLAASLTRGVEFVYIQIVFAPDPRSFI